MEMGKCLGIRVIATAQNVSDAIIQFNTDSSAATGAIVTVRRAGVLVAWDGLITVGTDVVSIGNTGGVDWAADDTIDIVIF
jgi:hypothetical protein